MTEKENYEVYCRAMIDACSTILQILEMPESSKKWLTDEIDSRRKEVESMLS